MTNPRAVAVQIIYLVCFEGCSLSDAFDSVRIPDSDRPFIKELCFGTIRFWIKLQAILKMLLEKPLKAEDKDIECLLCVGLYQLLFMQVPDYALVDETVTATRVLKKSWASGLVNKILRMAIEKNNESELMPKGITAQTAHPNWIIDKIKNAWPENCESILNANNQKAPLFLRVNQTKISRAGFEKLLTQHKIDFEIIADLSHGILLPNPLPVEKIPGFLKGLFSVQDASGQKVVAYLDVKSDHTVLDACAAPGSKTTHILETCPDIQKLVAIDIEYNRLKKIKENIKRLQLNHKNIKLIAADAQDIDHWWDGESFDRILLDAPCSASGVIRRHPDIKLLRKKTDINNLAKLQYALLESLWPLLKNTGKLLYTTCSVFPDENEAIIEKFLSAHDDAKIIAINNTWGNNLKYGQQVLTGERNRDGFYYSVISRI